MKSLAELKHGECKYALTTSAKADKSWSHARLGDTQGALNEKGEWNGGGNYPHGFCGAPVKPGSVYCREHHALCYRGQGKDARSLEEMIYATDKSQYRGRSNYAEHTDPLDKEVERERNPVSNPHAGFGGLRVIGVQANAAIGMQPHSASIVNARQKPRSTDREAA